jgi:predicted ATP-grasp superfamily ATP-dependent carboligase
LNNMQDNALKEEQSTQGAMIILVLGDHRKYFHVTGESILSNLSFPVIILANRISAEYFRDLGPNVTVLPAQWSNFENVRQQVIKIAGGQKIFSVATINEGLMLLAAELREELNLSGMSLAVATGFRDKLVMKRRLADAGVRVPRHTSCNNPVEVIELFRTSKKLVIKPIDGVGSRRVSFFEQEVDIQNWFKSESEPETYEAEEYINGTLFHVNAIVRDSKVLLSAAAMYVPGMANIDYQDGQPFVSVMVEDSELKRRLEEFSEHSIRALSLENGVTHLECFVTSNNEIVMCEVAARPGGGGIVEMIESQYGINYSLASLLLQADQGNLIEINRSIDEKFYGLMGFRLPTNCKIKSMPELDLFRDDYISFARIYASAGSFVPAAKHCTDFVGLLVYSSSSHNEFHARTKELHQRFYAKLEVN